MEDFERLVSEQMKTMEKLLYLQSELERCQELEKELMNLEKQTELKSIQKDIDHMKKEIREIHQMFERQTEEVISTYQNLKVSASWLDPLVQ